jgi:hypothetical protein
MNDIDTTMHEVEVEASDLLSDEALERAATNTQPTTAWTDNPGKTTCTQN